jgi:pheromone shutdown protein TraB
MFNYGNILRDQHMCSAIAELIDRGERIILTAGSGHAVRIENTLKSVIQRR